MEGILDPPLIFLISHSHRISYSVSAALKCCCDIEFCLKDGSFSLIPFNPIEFKTALTLKLETLQESTSATKKTRQYFRLTRWMRLSTPIYLKVSILLIVDC